MSEKPIKSARYDWKSICFIRENKEIGWQQIQFIRSIWRIIIHSNTMGELRDTQNTADEHK